MRYNIQGIARDSYGIVSPDENISIYINNTEICATVYTTEESTNKIDTCPQIQTDEKGIFNIWFDSDDYEDLTTTVDIELGSETVENIKPFKLVDNRVLNTTNVEGESVYDAYNPEFIDIDGGSF